MTWIKKQLLVRAVTMTLMLVCFSGLVMFIDSRLLSGVCCLAMAVVAIIRLRLVRESVNGMKPRIWALRARPSYPAGDEREQHLVLSAGYIAGQTVVVLTIVFVFGLALMNAAHPVMVPLPVVVVAVLGMMIIHEWLVVGLYWYLEAHQ